MGAATATGTPEHATTDSETTRSGLIAWRDPRLLAAAALLLIVAIAAAIMAQPLGLPADLLAVWTAGEYWQMGRVDEVYPTATGLFTMLPPESWVPWLDETQGYRASVYPFLYPPLWAVVMGWLAPASFAPVAAVSYWINAGLLAATILLAIRASGALLNPVLHAVLVVGLFFTTHVASVGFLQGQPHILVGFLIVLAIERTRAGRGTAAGIALALAASIKLFPAIYVVVWLVRGEKRALLAFAAAGAALAAASILLAGWPLHRAFLDSVSQMGRTLLLTGNSLSFDAVVGHLFLQGEVQAVRGPSLDTVNGVREAWLVAPRPALWAAIANGGLVAALLGIALAARRASVTALYAGLWPALLTLTVVFTPTGWLYYAIPAAAFAPALFALQPQTRGAALFLGGYGLFFAGRLSLFKAPGGLQIPETFFYIAATLTWGLGFVLLARSLAKNPRPD